jgi:hypothetical protein
MTEDDVKRLIQTQPLTVLLADLIADDLVCSGYDSYQNQLDWLSDICRIPEKFKHIEVIRSKRSGMTHVATLGPNLSKVILDYASKNDSYREYLEEELKQPGED